MAGKNFNFLYRFGNGDGMLEIFKV